MIYLSICKDYQRISQYFFFGMLVAFAVSIFAIKFLMQYIKKHDFKAFGWYRIVLGVIVLLYFVIKTVILKS